MFFTNVDVVLNVGMFVCFGMAGIGPAVASRVMIVPGEGRAIVERASCLRKGIDWPRGARRAVLAFGLMAAI